MSNFQIKKAYTDLCDVCFDKGIRILSITIRPEEDNPQALEICDLWSKHYEADSQPFIKVEKGGLMLSEVNKLCAQCIEKCKQWKQITVVRCPNYRCADSKHKEKAHSTQD